MAYFIIHEKCTACNYCMETCTNGAIINLQEEYYINPLWCNECGACQAMCAHAAIFHENLDIPSIFNNEMKPSQENYFSGEYHLLEEFCN